MESSGQKKCPECSSNDVFDTGNRSGNGGEMSFGDIFSSPAFSVYQCNRCHKSFIYLGHYRDRKVSAGSDDTIGGLPF